MQDLTGKRFGRWTVIKLYERRRVFSSKGKKRGYKNYWLCKCDCGNEKVVNQDALKQNNSRSCGCFKRQKTSEIKTKHGQSKTRIQGVYNSMKDRCYNKNNKKYPDYGGRGITVCEEWKNNAKFFYDWPFTNNYKKGLTLDRIDVNGNYEPNNCRWVTMKEQNRNRRDSHLVEYNGKIQCISAWEEEFCFRYGLLRDRLRAGWDIEKALTTPVRQRTIKK